MKLNYHLLRRDAYSKVPLTFIDQEAHNCLASIASIEMIENGNFNARIEWQDAQLSNLLEHARSRSKFWKKRIFQSDLSSKSLMLIPILSRKNLASQIEEEGPLINYANQPLQSYVTSGSTGEPVKVFMHNSNSIYNVYRTAAISLASDLNLADNLTELTSISTGNKKISVEIKPSWIGPLSQLYKSGTYKKIDYADNDEDLIRELKKDRLGYLKAPSGFVEKIFRIGGTSIFKELGIAGWIHLSDTRDPSILSEFDKAGIRSYSNYSAGEVGYIATECSKNQNFYHVATSNVIVELDKSTSAKFNGVVVNRILVTHLHSYATPIIRYDIGDMGELHEGCSCGHAGPTLSNIIGRQKSFIHLSDGTMIPFYGRAHEILKDIEYIDSRIKQINHDELLLEITSKNSLTDDEKNLIISRVQRITDGKIRCTLKTVIKIDWGQNKKKLFFSSEIKTND